jgi:hypothetical protein
MSPGPILLCCDGNIKGLKKIVSIGNLVDSSALGVVFRLRISPRIRSQNRNGLKCSARYLCRTELCKNSENPPCCHVPLRVQARSGMTWKAGFVSGLNYSRSTSMPGKLHSATATTAFSRSLDTTNHYRTSLI